jgi:hypothetical protein
MELATELELNLNVKIGSDYPVGFSIFNLTPNDVSRYLTYGQSASILSYLGSPWLGYLG